MSTAHRGRIGIWTRALRVLFAGMHSLHILRRGRGLPTTSSAIIPGPERAIIGDGLRRLGISILRWIRVCTIWRVHGGRIERDGRRR